jgi:transcriptional regulator with XRE-family HTH domain
MANSGFSHLGESLRQARVDKKLSQLELARKLGFTQATISHAENGRDLKLGTLVEIARALDLEPLLVPRKLVPAINTIVGTEAANRRTAIIHDAGDDTLYTEEIAEYDRVST